MTSDAKLLLFIFSGTMRQPWRRSALHRVFIVVLLFLAWNRRICGVSSDLQNVESDNGNYDGIAVASDPDPASSSSTDSKMLYDSGVSGEGSEEIDSHQNAFAVQTDGSSESVIEDVNTGIPESLGSPEIPRDKVLDIDQEILTAADEDSSELHSGQVENNKGISSPGGPETGEDINISTEEILEDNVTSSGTVSAGDQEDHVDEVGVEQEPIFVPDDDELVDDSLFRDIIQDEKIDQLNQNGADAAVSSNGENGNTLKVKNGENPGMTTTTKSKSKGDSDWLTTEEEILTFSLFKLYAYILTVCLVVMSFSIWIMWFRYSDVISAVHGSKGVLFFETPQNARINDNWTGLPGAHCRPNKAHFYKGKNDEQKKSKKFNDISGENINKVVLDVNKTLNELDSTFFPSTDAAASTSTSNLSRVKKKKRKKKKKTKGSTEGYENSLSKDEIIESPCTT